MPVTLVLRRLRADGKEKDLPKRKQDKTNKSHNSSISFTPSQERIYMARQATMAKDEYSKDLPWMAGASFSLGESNEP